MDCEGTIAHHAHSSESHPNYPNYAYRLSNGWIPGRKVVSFHRCCHLPQLNSCSPGHIRPTIPNFPPEHSRPYRPLCSLPPLLAPLLSASPTTIPSINKDPFSRSLRDRHASRPARHRSVQNRAHCLPQLGIDSVVREEGQQRTRTDVDYACYRLDLQWGDALCE